jgi:hypothetical protein
MQARRVGVSKLHIRSSKTFDKTSRMGRGCFLFRNPPSAFFAGSKAESLTQSGPLMPDFR